MSDLKDRLNEHDEDCIGPSLQGACNCMEERATADIKKLQREIEDLQDAYGQACYALGLLTTLHPMMEIDAKDPVGMAEKIIEHVTGGANE